MSSNPLEKDIIKSIKDLEARLFQLEKKANYDLTIAADNKIYLDGTDKTAWITWNSASSRIEFYVGSVLEGYIDAANTGTRLQNT